MVRTVPGIVPSLCEALVVAIIVARLSRHREWCGAGAEVGVDDEIEVLRPRDG